MTDAPTPAAPQDPLDRITELVGALAPAETPAAPASTPAAPTAQAPGAAAPWTAAQALAHCAQSIEYSVAGYPRLRSRLFRAMVGPLVKRRFLRAGAMSHDTTAPVAGAPTLAPSLSLAEARARLAAAIATFRAHAGPLAPHLAYGACTRPEYARLHLLHVEDHLRALAPGTPGR